MKTTCTFFLICFTILSSCNLLSNSDDPPPEPGPRNYTWKTDTLDNGPSGWLSDIWGASPNEVWAVSTGGYHTVWYFDGNSWEPYQQSHNIPSGETVHGFSRDNVWIGGGNKIYHFAGNSWTLSFEYNKPGVYASYITDIWGESTSDLYAVGTYYRSDEETARGFILHYNGDEWRELLTTEFSVQLIRIRNIGGSVISVGYNRDSYPDSMFFLKVEKNRLRQLYSITNNEVPGISLNRLGNKIYYVIGDIIYSYNGKDFDERASFINTNFAGQIYGRHEKDIFLRMTNGIAHYNGEEIKYLFSYKNSLLSLSSNAILLEKDVFFIVNNFGNGTDLIYKGILTDTEQEE